MGLKLTFHLKFFSLFNWYSTFYSGTSNVTNDFLKFFFCKSYMGIIGRKSLFLRKSLKKVIFLQKSDFLTKK